KRLSVPPECGIRHAGTNIQINTYKQAGAHSCRDGVTAATSHWLLQTKAPHGAALMEPTE
ncbi:Hypothetical predicted protein, partial [Xyrichtys novacula]